MNWYAEGHIDQIVQSSVIEFGEAEQINVGKQRNEQQIQQTNKQTKQEQKQKQNKKRTTKELWILYSVKIG